MLLGDYSSFRVPLPDSVGNEQILNPDEMKSHFRKLNTGRPPLRDLAELAEVEQILDYTAQSTAGSPFTGG